MMWKSLLLILVMGFYSSAAAHDYSRMTTVRGEVADQSHPQNTQWRMLKNKESIRKKKQNILSRAIASTRRYASSSPNTSGSKKSKKKKKSKKAPVPLRRKTAWSSNEAIG